MRIDAETGDKAVHHELHVSVLAACPPPEGFGWVEQQSLVGQRGSLEHISGEIYCTSELSQYPHSK